MHATDFSVRLTSLFATETNATVTIVNTAVLQKSFCIFQLLIDRGSKKTFEIFIEYKCNSSTKPFLFLVEN